MDNTVILKDIKKAFWIIVGFMIVVLVCTGSLTSGYHLVDDHCLYSISDELGQYGLLKTLVSEIRNDLFIRFRPLYIIEQVIGTALFGTHLILWNLYKLIEALATSFFLFVFSRKIKLNQFWSWLLVVIVMCGEQFICWSRVANQENTGLLLCSIGLYLLVAANDDAKKITRFLFVLTTIAMSLMKESFVIFVPAIYLLEACIINEKDNKHHGILESLINPLKNNVISWIVIGVVDLTELLCIVFFVGTNKIEYAGFSTNTSVREYANGILGSIKGDLKYPLILIVGVSLLLIYLSVLNKTNYIKAYSMRLMLAAYIFISQLILHAKSGMESRYMIPWVFSVAIMCAWIPGELEVGNKGDLWFHDYKLLTIIYAIISIFLSLSTSIQWAEVAPTGDGKFLTETYRYTNSGDVVGVYGIDGEYFDSINIWLNHRNIQVIHMNNLLGNEGLEPETILIHDVFGDVGDSDDGIDLTKYHYVWVGEMYSVWRRNDI